MIRCLNCGSQNRTQAKFCSACGKKLNAHSTTIKPQQKQIGPAGQFAQIPQKRGAAGVKVPQVPQQQAPLRGKVAPQIPRVAQKSSNRPPSQQKNRFLFVSPQLDGTVISVDQPYDEPPDFSLAKFIVGIIVAGFLLPLILAAFITFGILFAVLQFLGMGRLVQAMNPLHWFGLLSFLGLGRKSDKQNLPVRNFRIRDKNGSDRQVKMKGHLKVGNIGVGDYLAIWGKWKAGVLVLKSAYNFRTQSHVKLKTGNWPKIFLIFILAFFIVSLISQFIRLN